MEPEVGCADLGDVCAGQQALTSVSMRKGLKTHPGLPCPEPQLPVLPKLLPAVPAPPWSVPTGVTGHVPLSSQCCHQLFPPSHTAWRPAPPRLGTPSRGAPPGPGLPLPRVCGGDFVPGTAVSGPGSRSRRRGEDDAHPVCRSGRREKPGTPARGRGRAVSPQGPHRGATVPCLSCVTGLFR